MSETQPGVQQYYPIAESQHGQQYNPNMVSGRSIQQEGQVIETSAMNNRFTPGVQDPFEDCFRVVRSTQQVGITCTRNETRRYKVSVPKQVHKQVPKRVEYVDYETRERKEPYQVKRFETAYREENQQYTVQVPKKVTNMVKVTKRVPKTVYVDIVTEELREETIMVPETRNHCVKIPYRKEVLEKQYRTVTERVPVTKYRTEYDNVAETVYEDMWKTECVPVTNIVYKQIPVYNIVTNEGDLCEQIDRYPANYNQAASPVQVLSEQTYNDRVQTHVETYPPQVVAHPEPMPINQVPPENKPQPSMNAKVTQNPDPAPIMQSAPVIDNNEPFQIMQPLESVPVKEGTPVQNNTHPASFRNDTAPQDEQKVEKRVENNTYPASFRNDTAPQDEQKVEKWVETKYVAPAEYDRDNNGVLDAQELEDAQAEGKLHIEQMPLVENPKEDETVVEVVDDAYSQSSLPERKKKKKNMGRRRKRKSRR